MSRIGRQPIPVPSGVDRHDRARARCASTGPRASCPSASTRDIDGQAGRRAAARHAPDRPRRAPRAARPRRARSSRTWSQGVTDGYEKRLEIQGVGYRAQLKGKNLELARRLLAPGADRGARRASSSRCPQPTRVVVRGISKQLVGETAAIIRKQRPPEPYKGKGIRYEGEYVAAEGRQARMTRRSRKETAPAQAPPPRAREGLGHRRASAHLRVPLQPRHLRAADRRRRRAARSRRSTGTEPELRALGEGRARDARRRAARRARARRPASARRCSTAAATATTATCKRVRRGDPRGGITV